MNRVRNYFLFLSILFVFVSGECSSTEIKGNDSPDFAKKVINNDEWEKDDEIAKVKKQLLKDPYNSKLIVELAELYRRKSKFYEDRYVEILIQGKEIDPMNLAFPIMLAAYYSTRQYCGSLKLEATAVILTDDKYPTMHIMLAECYKREGLLSVAKRESEKAISLLQSDDILEYPNKRFRKELIKALQDEIKEIEELENKKECNDKHID